MDPALASLLGALIGGGIAGGFGFGLERMRAAREERAAERRDRQEARRAARLLAEELEYGRALVARAQEKGWYTWGWRDRLLATSAWTEYRADFALVASERDWAMVAAAFRELGRLNRHIADVLEEDHWTGYSEQRHPYHEPRELNSDANLDEAVETIDAALGLLRNLMAG